jgi:hypothetical protein
MDRKNKSNNNIEEELISFETAKLAKEKGFNEKVVKQYDKHKYKHRVSRSIDCVIGPYEELLLAEVECFAAPTQSLLQRWLREKHNIFIWVTYKYPITNPLQYKYILMYKDSSEKCFNSYEEALEKGLQEALKLIK